jgi:hypothetical protein
VDVDDWLSFRSRTGVSVIIDAAPVLIQARFRSFRQHAKLSAARVVLHVYRQGLISLWPALIFLPPRRLLRQFVQHRVRPEQVPRHSLSRCSTAVSPSRRLRRRQTYEEDVASCRESLLTDPASRRHACGNLDLLARGQSASRKRLRLTAGDTDHAQRISGLHPRPSPRSPLRKNRLTAERSPPISTQELVQTHLVNLVVALGAAGANRSTDKSRGNEALLTRDQAMGDHVSIFGRHRDR